MLRHSPQYFLTILMSLFLVVSCGDNKKSSKKTTPTSNPTTADQCTFKDGKYYTQQGIEKPECNPSHGQVQPNSTSIDFYGRKIEAFHYDQRMGCRLYNKTNSHGQHQYFVPMLARDKKTLYCIDSQYYYYLGYYFGTQIQPLYSPYYNQYFFYPPQFYFSQQTSQYRQFCLNGRSLWFCLNL